MDAISSLRHKAPSASMRQAARLSSTPDVPTLKLKSCFLEQSENNLNWIEPAHDIIKEARYHACSLLSVQVVKIRLEPRGTLEISIEKAKQEGRLTATAGKKQDWYIWLDPLHCRPYDTARRVGKVVFQKNTVYLHSC